MVLIENHSENLTQKGLAELLQIDKSYMVTIVDYLTDKGYVFREKNPSDRREQLIKLTPRAKKDLVEIKDAFAELNEKSLKNIDKKQIAVYNEVIKAIELNLNHGNPNEIIVDFKKI
ncbi:MAG TPA: MarR family transcriptional regulator [Sphingobacteriaceae bacterium]